MYIFCTGCRVHCATHLFQWYAVGSLVVTSFSRRVPAPRRAARRRDRPALVTRLDSSLQSSDHHRVSNGHLLQRLVNSQPLHFRNARGHLYPRRSGRRTDW